MLKRYHECTEKTTLKASGGVYVPQVSILLIVYRHELEHQCPEYLICGPANYDSKYIDPNHRQEE